MKSPTFLRLVLAASAVGFALLSSGCSSSGDGISAPIAPNWYDSYYYKDGNLVVPEPPQNPPTAGIWE